MGIHLIRVLLVDDDLDLLAPLAESLRPRFEVVEAGSYGRALQFLHRGGFDAIVADLGMGGLLSGLDLLEEARTRTPRVARVLISGLPRGPRLEVALSSGLAQAFFSKPWPDGAIDAAIEALVASVASAG